MEARKFSKSNVQDELMNLVVDKLGVKKSDLTEETNFTDDLGADSLDNVELILETEKAFNIVISDDDSSEIKTYGEMISYVSRRLKEEGRLVE